MSRVVGNFSQTCMPRNFRSSSACALAFADTSDPIANAATAKTELAIVSVLSLTPPFWLFRNTRQIAVSSNLYPQFHGVILVAAYRSCGSRPAPRRTEFAPQRGGGRIGASDT